MAPETKIATYTILIAKQKEAYFIYPDNSVYWYLQPGDQIHFINKTESYGTLNVTAGEYFNDTPFDIEAGETETRTMLTISGIEGARVPFEITFSILDTEKGMVFVVFGGPKMVPTDPDFQAT